MTAKKCPSCGKERCPGIVMMLSCPEWNRNMTQVVFPQPYKRGDVTKTVTTLIKESGVVTNHRGQGWRLKGDKPMTPAERQRRHRGKE